MFFIDCMLRYKAWTLLIFGFFILNMGCFLAMKYAIIDSHWLYRNVALSSDFAIVLQKPLSFFVWYILHLSAAHLLINLAVLWAAAVNLSHKIGEKKAVFLFFAANLFCGAVFIFSGKLNSAPVYLVGMSGGVFSVLLLSLLTDFRHAARSSSVYLVLAGLYAVIYVFSTNPNNIGGNIAHFSGAVFGLLSFLFLQKGSIRK